MLFSRRKRAVAAEPAPAGMGVAGRGDAATSGQTDGAAADPDSETPLPMVDAPWVNSPAVADPAPEHVAFEPATSGPAEGAVADADTAPQHLAFEPPGSGIPIAPVAALPHDVGVPHAGEETGVADLNEFFAALRQVVDDSIARLPLESDRLEPPPLDEADLLGSDLEADREVLDPTGPGGATAALARLPENAIARGDEHAGELVASTDGIASSTSTELAPSTAELIAALEADRDRWRERAIVWRERAMGADMLVKTQNDHMAELRANLEDLRMVIRVMSPEATDSRASDTGPEPSPPPEA